MSAREGRQSAKAADRELQGKMLSRGETYTKGIGWLGFENAKELRDNRDEGDSDAKHRLDDESIGGFEFHGNSRECSPFNCRPRSSL